MVARTVGLVAFLAATASGAFVGKVVRQDGEARTAPGERCIGAEGFEFVEFLGCTEGFECTGVNEEFGFNCVPIDGSTVTVATGAAEAVATTAAVDEAAATVATEEGATTVAGDGATGVTAVVSVTEDETATETEEAEATAEVEETPEETPEDTPEESEEEETPEESDDDDDDGSVCFPADATVELQDGSVVPMSQVSIGDMVKVGTDSFSKVFMFTHKNSGVLHKFVTLETASGASLALTKGHYIYADDSLIAAENVKVGSTVTLGNGEVDTVTAVGSTTSSGLFNPQTVHGDVVVNGIVSSTYTTAVEPSFAHAILAPFRFLNTMGLYLTSLESGSQRLADAAPSGAALVI